MNILCEGEIPLVVKDLYDFAKKRINFSSTADLSDFENLINEILFALEWLDSDSLYTIDYLENNQAQITSQPLETAVELDSYYDFIRELD